MTTIAYKDGILAADSAVSQNGCIVGVVEKVFRAVDGGMAAVAGPSADLELVRAALAIKATGEGFDIVSEDAEALVVRPDGSIYFATKDCQTCSVDAEFHAIGSGFQLALGAMAAGATAEEAVHIAIRFDEGSSGHVSKMELGK